MVKIGVQQPPAALKPEKEKEGGDGVAGTVLLPPGAVSAGRAGTGGRPPRPGLYDPAPVGAAGDSPLCAGSSPFSAKLGLMRAGRCVRGVGCQLGARSSSERRPGKDKSVRFDGC